MKRKFKARPLSSSGEALTRTVDMRIIVPVPMCVYAVDVPAWEPDALARIEHVVNS